MHNACIFPNDKWETRRKGGFTTLLLHMMSVMDKLFSSVPCSAAALYSVLYKCTQTGKTWCVHLSYTQFCTLVRFSFTFLSFTMSSSLSAAAADTMEQPEQEQEEKARLITQVRKLISFICNDVYCGGAGAGAAEHAGGPQLQGGQCEGGEHEAQV